MWDDMVNISRTILSGLFTFLCLGMVIMGLVSGVYLIVYAIKEKALGAIFLGVFFLLMFIPLAILFIAKIIGM